MNHHVDTELSNSFLTSWKYISQKIEQQVNVKFLVKLNKTAPKIFNWLSEMQERMPYQEHTFEWHKSFSEENNENCWKCGELEDLCENWLLLGMVLTAQELHIGKETARQILAANFTWENFVWKGPKDSEW